MTSNLDNPDIKIPIADVHSKILEIVCSPRLNHVAALHENNDISVWSIISQESQDNQEGQEGQESQKEHLMKVKTIPVGNIRRYEKIDAISDDQYVSFRKIFAISDNKQVSISIERTDSYNFISTTKLAIDRFHLIASQKGERLLYRYIQISGMKYNLMDPYSLKNPVNANKLFENKQIQEQYIIKSDKIIYTNYGKVLIKKLVDDNWVEYLRKYLKDTNSITTPSKNTIDLITKITRESSYDPPYSNEFEGKFLKWSLELSDESVNLMVNKLNTSIEKQLDILPSLKDTNGINLNGQKFIIHCKVLENDDFVTITRIGIFIWTYKLSDIKMHYYWNDYNDSLENFNFGKEKLKILTENWTSGRILPASNYQTIIKNLHVKFGEKELFNEFLKRNIEDEFYLTSYGKDLMETFIMLNEEGWIRNLGHICVIKCLQSDTEISKISLLSIIFENFNELSKNHPQFIAAFLSLIGFIVPYAIVIPKSTSSHLSKYGRYYYLYNTSSIDILTSILWDYWISIQNSFQKSFQNFKLVILAFEI
ncbi:hypothetical protein C2G38_2137371 [Gigaspora rosea]|uniref:Uncharacterized protein n=1 Tax=Gigaspora rosea TaxID=44941 RepID=A0A397W4W7_9GLOM|nr:hypothetical protein C2G38_2137371 [Gigaspora rosea]